MSLFWFVLTKDVETVLALDMSLGTRKLKPRTSPFWQGSTVSILNYEDDFYDLVRSGKIEVHISDVDQLLENSVRLGNGTELNVDAIMTATGWKHTPPIKFLPFGVENDLGLPDHQSASERELELEKLANAEILDRFPILKNAPTPPALNAMSRQHFSHPWRLFRFIVPPAFVSSRTIAFTGMLFTVRTPTIAEIQALWITSYFDGTIDIEKCLKHFSATKSRRFEDSSLYIRVLWDTMLMTQFGILRHPHGVGDRNPEFMFDALPYFDLLLGDLGLKKRRKNGWLAEITEQYLPEDHGGIVGEWLESRKKD